MFIVKSVEDLPASFPRADQMHLPQTAQLMGHSGFAHREPFRQCANAHLAFKQEGDDAHAAGVTKSAEEFGKLNSFEFSEFHLYEYMNKYSYISS